MKFPVLAALLASTALPLHAQETAPEPASEAAEVADAVWAFEESDIPVDPAYVFGQLDNGMRYVIRQNDRPEGTGIVRLIIDSGSLSEREEERGLAHFLEHMAFNGSKRIPEGEMVKLLEREGLAFGADTNASTGFEQTIYKLDLPRNDTDLLDTALMIMRETASELTLDPEAIDRERGVILAERRDRNSFAFRELVDRLEFQTPGALHTQRLPIGLPEVLENATAEQFRAFYEREYVPANTTLVVIGDFAPETVEQAIRTHFESWRAAPLPQKPVVGPIDLERTGEVDIYIDPALSERVTISRLQPYVDRPDTAENRRMNILRQVGYGIISRRLSRIASQDNAPFRSAGFGTSDIFEAGRATNLVIATPDGGWRKGMEAGIKALRTATAYGFSEAEVAEQVARTRNGLENAVSAADTRTNASHEASALALINDDVVPSTPQSSLERFEAYVDTITPETVFAALEEDAAALVDPLIRFRGRKAPDGGAEALQKAWTTAMAAKIEKPVFEDAAEFAYTDFGEPGTVVSDTVDEELGIRRIVFENGVRLNLKTTDLTQDRIRWRLNLDGGDLLNTKDNPSATALTGFIAAGGLGEHSRDELASVLAGRSVGFSLGSGGETFTSGGTTTRRDLLLQMQLLAAGLTDPGYRPEGESQYRRSVANFYKSLNATPGAAYANTIGSILSDGDPRFSLRPESEARALTYADLQNSIGDRLQNGAIELAFVGDFDPDEAIEAVATTFGALPAREPDFLEREEARKRSFTADRSPRVITHIGASDQSQLRLLWPTTDGDDLELYLTMEMLERVARLGLQEELRERLGQAYSPGSSNSMSRTYTDYGVFSLYAGLDVAKLDEARDAMLSVVEKLRSEPVDEDTLERARRPLLEGYDNALKSNNGWLSFVDRAQSRPEDVQRFFAAREVIAGITPEAIMQAAERFLDPAGALEVRIVPATPADAEPAEAE
ncbi:pitrilysin family protein [Erythrobacter sp. HKB08]|uniref:M16 family metallopeptidase n=1 Tax=Erythrobacter sp. HKB08 TaxID=2502843 RepID=UPI001008B71E|nr:insulinase family protein [Erythrobacter sp. HKB08]